MQIILLPLIYFFAAVDAAVLHSRYTCNREDGYDPRWEVLKQISKLDGRCKSVECVDVSRNMFYRYDEHAEHLFLAYDNQYDMLMPTHGNVAFYAAPGAHHFINSPGYENFDLQTFCLYGYVTSALLSTYVEIRSALRNLVESESENMKGNSAVKEMLETALYMSTRGAQALGQDFQLDHISSTGWMMSTEELELLQFRLSKLNFEDATFDQIRELLDINYKHYHTLIKDEVATYLATPSHFILDDRVHTPMFTVENYNIHFNTAVLGDDEKTMLAPVTMVMQQWSLHVIGYYGSHERDLVCSVMGKCEADCLMFDRMISQYLEGPYISSMDEMVHEHFQQRVDAIPLLSKQDNIDFIVCTVAKLCAVLHRVLPKVRMLYYSSSPIIKYSGSIPFDKQLLYDSRTLPHVFMKDLTITSSPLLALQAYYQIGIKIFSVRPLCNYIDIIPYQEQEKMRIYQEVSRVFEYTAWGLMFLDIMNSLDFGEVEMILGTNDHKLTYQQKQALSAVVLLPDSPVRLDFYEYYSMSVPMFLPGKRLQARVFGIRGYQQFVRTGDVDSKLDQLGPWSLPPMKMFSSNFSIRDAYTGFCSWYNLPHLLFFDSAVHLYNEIISLDHDILMRLRDGMKRENARHKKRVERLYASWLHDFKQGDANRGNKTTLHPLIENRGQIHTAGVSANVLSQNSSSPEVLLERAGLSIESINQKFTFDDDVLQIQYSIRRKQDTGNSSLTVWINSPTIPIDMIIHNQPFLPKNVEYRIFNDSNELWKFILLYTFGGLYLDANVFLTKPITSWIKTDSILLPVRNRNDIFTGLLYSARPKHHVWRDLIYGARVNDYSSIEVELINSNEDGGNTLTGRSYSSSLILFDSNKRIAVLSTTENIQNSSLLYLFKPHQQLAVLDTKPYTPPQPSKLTHCNTFSKYAEIPQTTTTLIAVITNKKQMRIMADSHYPFIQSQNTPNTSVTTSIPIFYEEDPESSFKTANKRYMKVIRYMSSCLNHPNLKWVLLIDDDQIVATNRLQTFTSMVTQRYGDSNDNRFLFGRRMSWYETYHNKGHDTFGGNGLLFSIGMLNYLEQQITEEMWYRYLDGWSKPYYYWDWVFHRMLEEQYIIHSIYRGPWVHHPFGGLTDWNCCQDEIYTTMQEGLTLDHIYQGKAAEILSKKIGEQRLSTIITLHKVVTDTHYHMANQIFNFKSPTIDDYLSLPCDVPNCDDCHQPPKIVNRSCSDDWLGGCKVGDPDCHWFREDKQNCQAENRFYWQQEFDVLMHYEMLSASIRHGEHVIADWDAINQKLR